MKTWIPAIVIALSLVACQGQPAKVETPTYEQAASNPFRMTNYAATDALLKNYGSVFTNNRGNDSGPAPFVITTLVNVDQLEQSSTLGRAISEQISSRLTQTGHRVIDLKVRNSVYMRKSEGEFLLTREIKETAATYRAQAVVVGTYAVSASFVHITLKLVDPASSMVLSAHDYSLPLDPETKSMLRKTGNNS